MKINVLNSTCAFSVLLLAACSSSSGSDPLISASEEALRVFADTGTGTQDVADVLASGGTLTAREVSEASWRENYAGDEPLSGEGYNFVDGSFSMEGDGNNLLVSFLKPGDTDETTIVIENAATLEGNSFRLEGEGIFFDVFVRGGLELADLLNDTIGSGYLVSGGVYYNEGGDGFALQTEFIIGTETTDDMIAQLGLDNTSATYFGSSQIRIRRDDVDWSTYNANVYGDLEMDADFAAQTVSGNLTNLFYEEFVGPDPDDEYPIDGSLILNETSIQANAFSGSMSADAVLIGDDPGLAAVGSLATYSGAFYGPDANEVGGTITGSGSFEDQGYLIQGTFTGQPD